MIPEDGKGGLPEAQKESQSVSLCTAPTSPSLKTLINSTTRKKSKQNKPAVFIKAAVMCISEYTQIPVNVCFRRGGPQRKHSVRTCVRGCQVRLQRLRCDVSHLIMDTCFLPSPQCTANMCDARVSVSA